MADGGHDPNANIMLPQKMASESTPGAGQSGKGDADKSSKSALKNGGGDHASKDKV